MADCGRARVSSSSEGSSSDGSTPPSSKHKKSHAKNPSPATGKYHKDKHGRKGKRKRKEKRKFVTSSSSFSSTSHDSTDSESPDITPKQIRQAATNKQSALFDIIQKHYGGLVTMISTCVDSFTNELYSENLISGDVQDQVITGQDPDSKKASRVLHSVKQKLKLHPEKVRTFVEVLKKEPVFDDLTKEIMSK